MAKKEEYVTGKSDAELLGLRVPEEEVALQEKSEEEVTLEEIDRLQSELEGLLAAKQASLPRCGHVNSHSRDLKNRKDNLECVLHKGHAGNHSAPHKERGERVSGEIVDDIEIVRDIDGGTWEVVEVDREWSDAAGADWKEYVPPAPSWLDGENDTMKWGEGIPGVQ